MRTIPSAPSTSTLLRGAAIAVALTLLFGLLPVLLALSLPSTAGAFSLFPVHLLEQSSRWATPELDDGIQVGIEPGFATDLGATTAAEIAAVEQVVRDAFEMWESDVLQFELTFDAPMLSAFEIRVFALPASDNVFFFNPEFFFGGTIPTEIFNPNRLLTNGQLVPGFQIQGATIVINQDRVIGVAAAFSLTPAQQAASLQRLFGHEIGHALGLGHPNSNNPFGPLTNYDTDMDPLNPMIINPADPLTGIIVSPNRDDEAIMSNSPCGNPFVAPCAVILGIKPDILH